MSYAGFTTNANNPFQRFSHGRRYVVALELLSPSPGDRILDFGAGNGHMLRLLYDTEPHATYVGFDPAPSQVAESRDELAGTPIVLSQSPPKGTFSKICCLETLEHIPDVELPGVLAQIRGLLTADGVLVVSVPIELGLSCLCKQAVRIAVGQREILATWGNIVRSLLYYPSGIRRAPISPGHVGFDYRTLRKTIETRGLHIIRTLYSPLPLGPVLNSQVFWVAHKH